ncbi:cytochrome P450 [Actinokineospora guangxiensis]|uniref:Cytochrome P450 n=1 Tax=Actinokineospora guangxiensis TaxID=1490288 RepID=A0ABW0EGL4_9PSEU
MLSFPFPAAPALDLEPEYRRLQREEPVCRVRFPHGEPAWLVTRHADARTVLSDARFSRAESLRRDVPRTTEVNFAGGIVAMDPPEHTRLRATCGQAFTARPVARLRESAEALARELLAGCGESFDAVADFAVPYTLRMICALLGVPYTDSDRFRGWAEAGLATTAITEAERVEATTRMWDYIADLVARRKREPADDLVSAMTAAQSAGISSGISSNISSNITDEELVVVVMTALVAGYETTSTQLPNFLYLLLSEPGLWERLVARPALVGTAVEELLRFTPLEANGASPRYATVDLELGGVAIAAGEPVVAATVAANRDPRVFTHPDRIDLARDPNPHLAFGRGPHFCLGAPLARLELRAALSVLAETRPGLRLGPAEPEWKAGMLVRGPLALRLDSGRVR